MEYPLSYKRYLDQGRRIFTDTRQIQVDGVFVALHGNQFDGNEFAFEALDKGAAYAIVDKVVKDDPRLILVKDTLSELQSMASLNRLVNKAKIIAITGSNGKTTTKELAYSIFKLVFNCIATKGNLNNHIGVPLTLLRIEESTEIAIVEMGANKPGDIMELCEIADPDIGLITSIGKAHLEGFGSLEGVVKTKFELFDFLIHKNGICVFNMISEHMRNLFQNDIKSIRFGNKGQEVDYSGILLNSFPSITLQFEGNNNQIELQSCLFGEYNYQNILASATLAAICGISFDKIQKGVAEYIPGNMRSQIIQKDSNTIIMDAYNANPSSMYEVVEIYDKMDFNTKWIILGEMAELGDHSDAEHHSLLTQVKQKHFDLKVFIGKNYKERDVEAGMLFFDDVLQCRDWLEENWPSHTAILIKGSRSSHLEQLIH
jgi:UDP-N-acetylmuramoyl-tripeptide--D-alanyl-D-alanine ligase